MNVYWLDARAQHQLLAENDAARDLFGKFYRMAETALTDRKRTHLSEVIRFAALPDEAEGFVVSMMGVSLRFLFRLHRAVEGASATAAVDIYRDWPCVDRPVFVETLTCDASGYTGASIKGGRGEPLNIVHQPDVIVLAALDQSLMQEPPR